MGGGEKLPIFWKRNCNFDLVKLKRRIIIQNYGDRLFRKIVKYLGDEKTTFFAFSSKPWRSKFGETTRGESRKFRGLVAKERTWISKAHHGGTNKFSKKKKISKTFLNAVWTSTTIGDESVHAARKRREEWVSHQVATDSKYRQFRRTRCYFSVFWNILKHLCVDNLRRIKQNSETNFSKWKERWNDDSSHI